MVVCAVGDPIQDFPLQRVIAATLRNLLRASSIVFANPKAPVYIQKKVRLGIQEFPLQRVIAATLRNLLRASSIVLANPKAPVYIQKKVRLGIQDFPFQRVIAATLRNLLRASSILFASPRAPVYVALTGHFYCTICSERLIGVRRRGGLAVFPKTVKGRYDEFIGRFGGP